MSTRPATPGSGSADARPPVTLATLRKMARDGDPFACLACYDAMTADWCARAGVHVLLAGDSAAQVVLGLPRTIDMPIDFAVYITAALKRGAPDLFVMADMPFLSYHTDEPSAISNAGRFMTEGKADCVKLEADASFAPLVTSMTRAGIPVCGHVGLRPQSVGLEGGYRAKGRTKIEIERLVDDAVALEAAGCVLLLVEATPPEATQAVLEATTVPVIGIGAGDACHGQILVVNDLIGMTPSPPSFVAPTAQLGPALEDAVRDWVGKVAARDTGGRRYTMRTTGNEPDSQSESGNTTPEVSVRRMEEVKPPAGSTERD